MVTIAFVFSYIVVINIISLLLMYVDKKRAIKGEWRIREKTFFIVATVGGSVGILLGMKWARHKTKHLSFKLFIPLILMIQISLSIWYTL